MHEHIETMMAALAARLRRDGRRVPRTRGPRRARGTFVPIPSDRASAAPAPGMRLAH
jgi:hypothetical protein